MRDFNAELASWSPRGPATAPHELTALLTAKGTVRTFLHSSALCTALNFSITELYRTFSIFQTEWAFMGREVRSLTEPRWR